MIETFENVGINADWCLAGLWDGIKPTPILTVSEWADEHRYLSAASEKGQWRTSRTPYLKEILDNLSPTSPYKEIVFQKCVQVGATESALNAVGCYIDIAPSPILYVMPTIDMAKGISQERIDQMIEATPNLSKKIRPTRERDSGNTVLRKAFPGGVLVLAGANTGSSLRSRPIRLLVLDEIDAYPISIDKEGSPISLAEKRTVTFSNRKIYKLSTPTVEGVSAIASAISTTDKRKYFVPLPCCGVFQALEFENLKWEKDYKKVWYECPHCGGKTEERFKTKFLSQGEWQVTDPKFVSKERVGYLINGLYSPDGWMSWKSIAKEYDESEGNEILRRAFINTVLGETYKESGDAPEWEMLYNRRENYPTYSPPKEVVLLTAGVDVQKDRIEIEIVGWCRGIRSYSVGYRVLVGDTADVSPGGVWDELAGIVGEKWIREDGRELPLAKMCVDAGYNTSEVYAFCRRFHPSQVVPIKGSDTQSVVLTPPRPVDRAEGKGKAVGTTALWTVGVSILKSELYGWLRLKVNEQGEFPEKYCHFPTAYDAHYFRMLTAEKLQKRIVKGYPKYEWVKEYVRNEALDCRLYARAGTYMVGVDRWTEADWAAQENSYGMRADPKVSRGRKKSSFWDR